VGKEYTMAELDAMQEKANEEMRQKIAEHAAAVRKQAFEIQVQVEEGGKMPTKAHQSDAGFDVYATDDITLYPGQVLKHPLNIRLKLPHSSWAEITTKSGLGSKGQLVYAGVIDQAYRGVVHVIMTNVNIIERIDEEGFPVMRTTPIVIKKGEKVAQLIMNPYCDQFYMVQVDKVDTNTERGEGGFGSTGKV
jgi:dUTP pyrophosphatase